MVNKLEYKEYIKYFMKTKFDISYWLRKSEEDYLNDTQGNFPLFFDKDGKKQLEKSPYFEIMSDVLQKRGFLLKDEFISIGKWKTRRQTSNYEKNSEDKVRELTKKAIFAPEKEKIQILLKLNGVGVRVASAILTVIYPERYCVIDYRAWRALLWLKNIGKSGQFNFQSYKEYSEFLDFVNKSDKIGIYFNYLKILRSIALNLDITARKLELAFWKFDQQKGQKK